jgi:RNA polymerase sigma-70 factor (ECF subfamily)
MRVEQIDLAHDRQLVEAWQAGDATAFDDLYRRYFGRLRDFCDRRVGSAAAEEVAQDTFVKALQALPRFSGERRFYPWLTVIASRLCIDHHRKNGRVQPSDHIDAGSVDDGLEARFTLQAELDHLDRALSRLGPRHAEVLDLRERRGLSYQEIAGQLGVPHSTVEALLFRARKALRREFQAVSAERLAAVPGLGWVVTRLGRARDRLTFATLDLGALGGTLAAGAVTAVLVALPSAPAPSTAVATTRAWRPPSVVVAPLTGPAPLPTPLSGTTRPVPAPPALTPAVRPTRGTEAQREASAMPLHLDLVQTGAGLDPAPVADRLTNTVSGRLLP